MTAAQKKAAKAATKPASANAAKADAESTAPEVVTTLKETNGGEGMPGEQIGDSGLLAVVIAPPPPPPPAPPVVEPPVMVMVRVLGQPLAEESGRYVKGETFPTTPERAAALGHLVEVVTAEP